MNFKIAYAACRGTFHIARDIPCQDVVTGGKEQNGAVIVLADGTGSCPHSADGAASATKAAWELLRSWLQDCVRELGEEDRRQMIKNCLEAVSRNPYPPEEQSCTLLFCVAHSDGTFVVGHLGDGYIFLSDKDGVRLLSDAENGEELNETFFITAQDAAAHLRIQKGVLQPGDTVLLCSDGAGDALYDRMEHRCADAVEIMAGWLGDFPEWEVSDALRRNMDTMMRSRSHDDMSIAILRCCAEPYGEEKEEE